MDNISPRRPSRPNLASHGLWSLWEIMLKKAALELARSVSALTSLERTCEHTRIDAPQLIFAQSPKLKEMTLQILADLRRVCILSNLDEVLPEIGRFEIALDGWPQGIRVEDARARAEHLKYRILDELESQHYFQVDREDVRYYGQAAPFGDKVAKKFKAATIDIQNAGNCLALQQSTACVFHLMRAMEVAVRQLSRRLGVTITPQTTWRQMTGSMDDKIKRMPEATELQKRKKGNWEAARANLHHVGSVWRNKTMHPASSYTRGQARDVLEATRVFMIGLCDL